MLDWVIYLFEGVIAGNKHVHVHISVIMEAHVALNTKSISQFIKVMTYPALPFSNFFLLYILFFIV